MSYRNMFAIFYAIFFTSVLSSCWGFSFFQWGQFLRSAHKTLRLLISLSLLNILPALYFAWIYLELPDEQQVPAFWNVFGTFLLALSIFSFYRIYHLLLSFRTIRNCLYEKEEGDTDSNLANRLQNIGPWPGQAVSVIVYVGFAGIGWLLLR